ncbi:MAG TPA: DUF4214 domain-containing protein [Burkholderiaceae bacterium]|jgi:hypothetical protein
MSHRYRLHRPTIVVISLAIMLSGLAGCGGNDNNASLSAAANAKRIVPQRKASANDYRDVVQDLYVAYFGRPADPGGLSNFENALLSAGAPGDLQGLAGAYATNGSVRSLIDSFGSSKESQTLYGSSSTSGFVTAVFEHVLGRAPQSGGLAYWSNAIDSGSLSVGNAALSIMAGAETNTTQQGLLDAQLIANRIAAAESFTAQVSSQNAVSAYSGSAAAATARAMLAEVNATTVSTNFTSTINATVTALANTVSGSAPGPSPMSGSAATWTATNNSLCTTLAPYYWEIGNHSGAAISGSVNGSSSSSPVTAATVFSIASASKWIYSTAAVQMRGTVSQITSADIDFLHFTSGYTYMGNFAQGSPECPQTGTVNQCLQQGSPAYNMQNPRTVGVFDYDSGHMENHAGQNGLGNDGVRLLQSAMQQQIGTDINIAYSQPLLAGGIYTTAKDYALFLRKILNGQLVMHDALGTSPVCTSMRAPCNSAYSPIPEAWHYSLGHWVEDDPATYGDGSFSSAGAFGFYPWIEASKTYYGMISREDQSSAASGEQGGYASAQCGRLVRHAWMTGVNQGDSLPDLPAGS